MYRKASLRTLFSILACTTTLLLAGVLAGCGGNSQAITISIGGTGGLTVVDGGDTLTLTATLANDSSSKGVTWTVSGGGTLSGETAATAIYTAPAIPATTLTVTVTATSVSDTTKTGTFTITVPPQLTVSPTWTGGPGGTLAGHVGSVYSVQLTTSVGTPPYTWKVDAGSPFPLPACLSMTSAGLITSNGPLTASCAVDPNITFDVTDSGTPNPMTASETLDLGIDAAPAIVFSTTTVPPATGTYGVAYSGTVLASGGVGPLTYTLQSGALPTGLNAITSAGAITGTPTAPATYNFTIKAADAFGDSNTQAYTVTINKASPTLTFTPVASQTYGAAAFQVSASDSSGVVSNGAVTYSLTVGPTSAGTVTSGGLVTITGVGTIYLTANQAATADYNPAATTTSFTVAAETPVLTFASVPTKVFGDAAFQVSATDSVSTPSSGAITYALTAGQTSTGTVTSGGLVTITGQGTIYLTATQAASGDYGQATATTTVLVAAEAPTLTFNTIAAQTYGNAPFQVTATDSSGPVSAGAITYSLTPAQVSTGTVSSSGLVTITGVGTIYLTATQAANGNFAATTATTTVTVDPETPLLSFEAIGAKTYGTAAFQVTASDSGTTPSAGAITYSLTSGPPSAGTVTSAGQVTITSVGTIYLTANQAANGNYAAGTATTSFTVNPETPILSFNSIPTQTYGNGNFQVTAVDSGTTPSAGAITYALTAGQTSAGTVTSGGLVTITGAGTIYLTATQAANGNFAQGTATTTVTVNGETPTLTFNSIPAHYVGDAAFQATATDSSGPVSAGAITYSLTAGQTSAGTVTSGGLVTIGSSAGTIYLTATQAANGNYAQTTATTTVTISPGLSITTGATLPTGIVGTAYSQNLSASGGTGNYTWTLISGSSALGGVGLTFNAGTPGVGNMASVGGSTPVAGGPASFTVQVSDTDSHSVQATFSVTINATLGITTGTLSPTYAYGGQTLYSANITTVGGVGPYTWSIASSSATTAAQMTTYGLYLVNSVTSSSQIDASTVIASAVTTITPLSITVQVKDSTGAIATATYTLTLYPQLGLIPNLPSVLEGANLTTGQETVTATGGSGSYSFSVSGLPSGLTYGASGDVLSLTGTAPSIANTYSFTVVLTDTATNWHYGSTNNESITVSAPGATVGGNITVTNACGGSSPNMPMPTYVKLYQGSTTTGYNWVQEVTTNSSGVYLFTGVAAGSYTIVPVYANPTGSTSAYYPASIPVTVSGTNLNNENFSAAIGYPVVGTVNYSGGVAGQIYLNLTSNNCGNNGAVAGTSLHTTGTTSSAPFTINGVPPGTYTLKTFEDPDTLGQGQPNATDPVASDQSVTVTTSAAGPPSPVNVTNPTYTTPTANPQGAVTQIPNGVLLFYQASTNGSNIEDANEYTVQWSTSSAVNADGGFTTVAGSHTFKAIGSNGSTVWILSNAILTGTNKFTVGQSYYFQAQSVNTLAGTTHPTGWFTGSSSVTIVNTATPCTSGCTAVTSSITIPSGITINTGAPLYEGFFQQLGNGAPTIYATVDLSPTTGSALSYTVSVPSGAGWTPFAILDENLDGQIDAGNPNDTNNNSNGYTVSGATQTVAGGTLASAGATATVSTYYYKSTYNGGSSTGYNLNIDVEQANQLPVAVELESGPNILYPIDLSDYCTGCGHLQWQTGVQLEGVTPSVGDTYTFDVWYLGNSTPSTITGQVTGWNGTGTLTGPAALPYNLLPTATATTTPGFSWSLPTADSTDTFQFWLTDNGPDQTSSIWQIPSNNSNSNGFSSSITSIPTFGTDPTGGGSTSSENPLDANDMYSWAIQATDSYNNQAEVSTWFQP